MDSKNCVNNFDNMFLRDCGNVVDGSSEMLHESLLPRSASEHLSDTQEDDCNQNLQVDQKFAVISSIVHSDGVRINRRSGYGSSHRHDMTIGNWSDQDDSFKDSGFICTLAAPLRSDDGSTDSRKEIRPNRLSVENGECAAAADIHARLLMDSEEAKESSSQESEYFGPAPPSPSLNVSDDGNSDSGEEIGPNPLSGENRQPAAAEDIHTRLLMESKETKNKQKRQQWMLEVPRKLACSGTESRRFKRGHAIVAEFDKSWEESPQAKKCHTEESIGAVKSTVSSPRDDEQHEILEKFNVGRQRSIVDAHQKVKGRKVKISGDSKKRVTFNRDKDIGKSEQKKVSPNEMKSRFGNLDSRFTSGSGRFL